MCSNSRKYSTVEVVHMFGPCSPQHEQTKNKPFLQSSKASLLTQSGAPLKTLDHVVTIGLGTPQQNVTLMMDTGSELTWTQCKPCIDCYKQQDPVYDPFSSSTYSRLSCGSECSELGYAISCFKGRCAYKREYNDGSYSEGVY
ncbi:hypothetical protein CASFOL_036347 [Castilleja foliolosa]|uniref:Peptidase A1 domain-containing protein n=1 Tax=Castilleja foliolosa TaxID=1961234 RepID=A0ABD3BVA8_9LAMI